MFYIHNKLVQRMSCTKQCNKGLEIDVSPQERVEISGPGVWKLGWNTCFWMDHGVCVTKHALHKFGQKWPVGPGVDEVFDFIVL